MMRADFGPQLDLFDPHRFGPNVTLIGLGGAGSAVLLALTKMGVMNVHGYDPDMVEEHNVPSQLAYFQHHLTEDGMLKTDAIDAFRKDNVVDGRQTFTGYPQRIGNDDLIAFDGVVISAVDSMESRKTIWRLIHPDPEDAVTNPERYAQASENELNVPRYFDCRMGARIVQIYCVNPEDHRDVAAYESYLFGDDEAHQDAYGARAFIGSAMILGGLLADQLATFYRGEAPKGFIEIDLSTTSITA